MDRASLQSGAVVPSDVELSCSLDAGVDGSGEKDQDEAGKKDSNAQAQPLDGKSGWSTWSSSLDARWTTFEAWWILRKESKHVRWSIRILSLLFFALKLAWALYVSLEVQGYYQQFHQLQVQMQTAQGDVLSVRTDLGAVSQNLVQVTSSVGEVSDSVVLAVHQLAYLNGTVSFLATSIDTTQTQVMAVDQQVDIVAHDVAGAQVQLLQLNASMSVVNRTLEIVNIQLLRMNATTTAVDEAVLKVATATSSIEVIKDQLDILSDQMDRYNESTAFLAATLDQRLNETSFDAQRRMDNLGSLINQQSESIQTQIDSSDVALSLVRDRITTLLRNLTMAELPVGSIVSLASASIPPGFLLCNGSSVSQTIYPHLFSAIGYLYGTSPPPGTFFLPDLRGRVTAGLDAMGSLVHAGRINNITNGLGMNGGQEAEALSMRHLPAHAHGPGTLNIIGGSHTHVDGGHTHSALQMAPPTTTSNAYATGTAKGIWSSGEGFANILASNHTHPSSEFSGTTASTGQNSPPPVSKLQPTMLLNFIIKAVAVDAA